jgi:hypothetical protein
MRNTLIAIAMGASLLFAAGAFAQGGMGWGGWGGPGMRGPGYHMSGGGGYGYGCGFGPRAGYGPGPGYSADGSGNYPDPGYYCWAPDQSGPNPETAPQAPAPQTTPTPKR